MNALALVFAFAFVVFFAGESQALRRLPRRWEFSWGFAAMALGLVVVAYAIRDSVKSGLPVALFSAAIGIALGVAMATSPARLKSRGSGVKNSEPDHS